MEQGVTLVNLDNSKSLLQLRRTSTIRLKSIMKDSGAES